MAGPKRRPTKVLRQLRLLGKTFPGRVRGTADPSAPLGMTKGTAAVPFIAATEQMAQAHHSSAAFSVQ
jgi:hypothetical protein